jgi:hypothetical protein
MQRRSFLGAMGAACAVGTIGPQSAWALAEYGRGYDTLLKRYVVPWGDGVNRVNYLAWSRNRADRNALDAAIALMTSQRPSTMSRAAEFAYWANLYNAVTVRLIVDRYPVRSIREIKSDGMFDPKAYLGPWRTKRVIVEGKAYSLDDIEHETMRPKFNDPRVHYAVNCASIGCPNLLPTAWCETSLERDLDQAARAFINHPRGVRIGAQGGLTVSSIFEWFKVDFGGTDEALLRHFLTYADQPLRTAIERGARIVGHDYDWSINTVAAQG